MKATDKEVFPFSHFSIMVYMASMVYTVYITMFTYFSIMVCTL